MTKAHHRAADTKPPGDMQILDLMVRLCHCIAFETETGDDNDAEFSAGPETKKQIVNQLFELTDKGKHSTKIASLAESFGLMLVKLEVHQMKQEQLIRELTKKNQALEQAKRALGEKNNSLMASLREKYSPAQFVGQCRGMQEAKKMALNIAKRPINTMILGASGTGKEVFAKIIHFNSQRADRPFVAINCTAIPDALFESEMFGIEKGVATGVAKRKGFFEQAHTGTVFLDEIGDMSLMNQAKLLRVLEEREVMRVGGTSPVKIDVKIISATNADIKTAVEQGKFREDLYYRLNVVKLHLPLLKKRKEDIIILAEKLLAKNCIDLGRPPLSLTDAARNCLLKYDWPGNVRELNNEMERAAALTLSDRVEIVDLSARISSAYSQDVQDGDKKHAATPLPISDDLNLANMEKIVVTAALEKSAQNKTKAAAILGITREGLRKKLLRWEKSKTG